MKYILVKLTRLIYKVIIKPTFFKINPEKVHHFCVSTGQFLGNLKFFRKIISSIYVKKYPELSQEIFEIKFDSPIGLAAGFDYEARLTQILTSIGFGFGTVGTITNLPYEGNAGPMLGRLPKSKSLLVNKGFKNLGIQKTLDSLKNKQFYYPVGLSIGKTNTANHKTQEEGVMDVVSAFRIAEAFNLSFSYYELNISCPNLDGTVEFYEPKHLRQLLSAVDDLNISKPVFIKMPISKTDEEILQMMNVIIDFEYIKAIIIGNLQRDRENPTFVKNEMSNMGRGNFSGLPCRDRSDELIKLVYDNYGSKIKIIGSGGVFSAEDAYRKIRLGASLIQMITGMIYEGPQVIAEINNGLSKMIKNDGYSNISDVIGKK